MFIPNKVIKSNFNTEYITSYTQFSKKYSKIISTKQKKTSKQQKSESFEPEIKITEFNHDSTVNQGYGPTYSSASTLTTPSLKSDILKW